MILRTIERIAREWADIREVPTGSWTWWRRAMLLLNRYTTGPWLDRLSDEQVCELNRQMDYVAETVLKEWKRRGCPREKTNEVS